MGDYKENLMRKVLTESKTFDVKETSYSEIMSSINHMINKVVDGNDWKDHYVISIKKDNYVFIVSGDVHHYIQEGRKVSFSTINTLDTSIDEIYASKPKDILEEVEKRYTDFLLKVFHDSTPASTLEERVSKLEEAVYGNNKDKQCNTDTIKYTNDVVDEIKVIYHYANECYITNSIENLRYVLNISINYIKKCSKYKASRLILLEKIDESNKHKTLFAVLIHKEKDGTITINYSSEFNNTTDDIINLRKEKYGTTYVLKMERKSDEIGIDKAILSVLLNFIACCVLKKDYITIESTRMMDKYDFINNIKDVLTAIEINKIPVVIKMHNKNLMSFGGLEWIGYKYLVIDPLNSEKRYNYYLLDDKIDFKSLISIKDILNTIYDNY